jgi:hypothetical protein
MVLYMISFFQLPKRVLHRLYYFRSKFFSQGDNEKRKYRLTKLSVVCRLKYQGGLGVHDLEVKIRALLGKWLARLLTEDGVWQQVLRKKYVGLKVISHVLWKPGYSHFWAGNMATKKHFFPFGSFSIKDGSEIRFWKEMVGYNYSSRTISSLVQYFRHRGDTLQKVMEDSPPSMSFRRNLIGTRLATWNELLQRLASIQLVTEPSIGILSRMVYSRSALCTKL